MRNCYRLQLCFVSVVCFGFSPVVQAQSAAVCGLPPTPEFAPLVSYLAPSELTCSLSARRSLTSAVYFGDADADARRAFQQAQTLFDAGEIERASLELRVASHAFPILADRFALLEADARMSESPDREVCALYREASRSPHRDVAVLGEVGRVRCLLRIHDRRAERALRDLRRRYPDLPDAEELTLLLAQSHENRGRIREAVRLFREIDFMFPGSSLASVARERLEGLRESGRRVRALSTAQRIDRLERLMRSGPHDLAREEVEALQALSLPRPYSQQVARWAARIARIEGRWNDARGLLRQAQGQAQLSTESRRSMSERARDMARAASARVTAEAEEQIRGLRRGRPLSRQPTTRLFNILRIATRAGLDQVAGQALRLLASRDRVPPGVCFNAAMIASGTSDGEVVMPLLNCAERHPRYRVGALFHRALQFASIGERETADTLFHEVIREEEGASLPYYSIWSRQHLNRAGAPGEMAAHTSTPVSDWACADISWVGMSTTNHSGKTGAPNADFPPPVSMAPETLASAESPASENAVSRPSASEQAVDASDESEDLEVNHRDQINPSIVFSEDDLVAHLEALSEDIGPAYPWIARARALVLLGEPEAASDELHSAYVAWRESRGRRSVRGGLVSVYRGAAAPRARVDRATWVARRGLGRAHRRTLAQAAATLGDYGLAVRFGGFGLTGAHPRPYAALVEDAARRHGIDPDLLHGVMRVESVFNPRVISYAGAIGLMQIMPRTGRSIAHRLGYENFSVDDLLRPEVNIDFAAWYLASLIERFDGRIPLAIASYNGGPHNVRRWMRDHSERIPLEAFLERIPFGQTHRYVRRVLTHYAAYRAMRGEGMPELATHLPEARPDRLAF